MYYAYYVGVVYFISYYVRILLYYLASTSSVLEYTARMHNIQMAKNK